MVAPPGSAQQADGREEEDRQSAKASRSHERGRDFPDSPDRRDTNRLEWSARTGAFSSQQFVLIPEHVRAGRSGHGIEPADRLPAPQALP